MNFLKVALSYFLDNHWEVDLKRTEDSYLVSAKNKGVEVFLSGELPSFIMVNKEVHRVSTEELLPFLQENL